MVSVYVRGFLYYVNSVVVHMIVVGFHSYLGRILWLSEISCWRPMGFHVEAIATISQMHTMSTTQTNDFGLTPHINFTLQAYWYRRGELEPKFRTMIYYNAAVTFLLCVTANLYFLQVGLPQMNTTGH